MNTVEAEVTEGFADFDNYRTQWDELFRAPGNEPSVSFEWTAAMMRHHVGPHDRCFIVRLLRDGLLIGAVPLVARPTKLMGVKVVMLGPISEQYNTHSGLLLREPAPDVVEAFVAVLFRLNARWDCFRMSRLLDVNPLTPLLHAAVVAQRRLHTVRRGLPAYFLALPASHQDYLTGRSAKFRNYLKRIERKVSEAGAIQVHELRSAADFDNAFGNLLQVERSSWKQAHGTSIAAVNHQEGFYREMCLGAMASGHLHLQWLTLNSEPIAYNLGYLRDGCYFYLKTSYDQRFRSISPATFLRARLMERLIGVGLRGFDFPGEPYEWESQWTDAVRWRQVFSIYPRTTRGYLLASVDRIKRRSNPSSLVAHVDARAQRAPRQQSS